MSVPNQIPESSYTGNGTTKTFAANFEYASDSDVFVTVNGVTPEIGQATFANGVFTFTTAPANGAAVRVYRSTPIERDTEYDNHDNVFRPRVVNIDFDRIWYVLQEYLLSLGITNARITQEIADRIQADAEMMNYILNEDNELKADYILRDENLKKYVDQTIGAIIGNPGFQGIEAQFVKDASGKNQQEINDKVKQFKTLYDFAAVGDGVTDDSAAIQAAFNYGKIIVTNGNYLITNTVYVNNDVALLGLGGTFKPNKKGGVFMIKTGVRFLGDNLNIDGSLYPFNWNADHGMYVFNNDGRPQSFKLINSRLTNVYGSGIRLVAKTIIVKNNVLINVTGNNWTADPSGAYDNYGDGIHAMGCSVGVIEGNYIDNTLIEQSDSYLGRGGIVTEFGANNVTIANNYIAGYDRGIHAESVFDNVIKNNSVEKCGAALLLSAAKNSTIESNTFTSNRKFTVGTFIGYASCYSYGENSGCSFLNNKLKVVSGLGYPISYVAMLFSGASDIKDILVEGNIIEGGFSTNGGENLCVKNNTFNADPDFRTVYFSGSASFVNNTFKEGVRLTAIAIAGKSVIEGNKFYDVSSNVIEVTNPTSSGFTINKNRFYLKDGSTNTSVISAYMGGDKIGEMSGNVVIAPHTERRNINLVDFAGSPSLNKIYTLEPNLLINGGGELQSLKISSVYGMSRNTLEFYKDGNTPAEPADDVYYQVGSRVYLADSTSADNPAFFIALNSGYATKTAWASGASVSSGEIRYNGSNVYKADETGTTGSTTPTHTSGSVSDGGVSWTYLGTKSLFKSVGARAATVANAAATDDTATKLNALITSLRNAGYLA